MKKITIILGIVIVVLVAGMLMFKYQSSPTAQQTQASPTPTPSSSPTTITSQVSADWKTYSSQKYGFAIQYPSDWKVNEIPAEQRNPFAPIIALESEAEAKIIILPKGEYDYGLPFSAPKNEEITINGHPASRSEWILGNGERLVRIGFYDWNSSNRIELHTSLQGNTEAQLEEMNRIISTFKLL